MSEMYGLTMRIISPEQLHDVINPLGKGKGKLFDATTGTKIETYFDVKSTNQDP